MEGEVIQMQEIFKFVREGLDAQSRILGNFRATGIRPRFLSALKSIGIELTGHHFDPTIAL